MSNHSEGSIDPSELFHQGQLVCMLDIPITDPKKPYCIDKDDPVKRYEIIVEENRIVVAFRNSVDKPNKFHPSLPDCFADIVSDRDVTRKQFNFRKLIVQKNGKIQFEDMALIKERSPIYDLRERSVSEWDGYFSYKKSPMNDRTHNDIVDYLNKITKLIRIWIAEENALVYHYYVCYHLCRHHGVKFRSVINYKDDDVPDCPFCPTDLGLWNNATCRFRHDYPSCQGCKAMRL